MQTNITILLGFILLLLTSCNSQANKDGVNFQTLVTDTSLSHKTYNELDFSRGMGSILNLPEIYNGVDSFELRIWVTGIMLPNNLLILKFVQNKWYAFNYSFYSHSDNGLDSMSVYNLAVPKEIDKIVSHLKQRAVLELPSQIAIPNFRDEIADGQTCTVEIATKKFYKSLQYHCPEHYSREFNNVKFMELVSFLNSFFNVYMPWCKPSE
jgi:hypothetical protein